MSDWRQKLRDLLDERGLSMKEVSLAAGLGETAVRDILERGRDPRRRTLMAIAGVLGMSLSELSANESDEHIRIPIIGAASAGGSWVAYDDVLGDVELRIDGGEPVAIEVKGDSMEPVYHDGDVLIGAKRAGSRADNLVGLDCIVQTDAGERYIKFLMRSTIRGRFNLRSYNPAHPDVEGVRLVWAAPVVWIRRGGRS